MVVETSTEIWLVYGIALPTLGWYDSEDGIQGDTHTHGEFQKANVGTQTAEHRSKQQMEIQHLTRVHYHL